MVQACVDLDTDTRVEELKTYIDGLRGREHPESYLIAVLHKAQELWGYLDRKVMDLVATEMRIPTSQIWGVATFYHYFNLVPRGRHVMSVCLGTACYIKGADRILEAIQQELGIGVGGTTEDISFSLVETRCLGACGIAPVMMVDDRIVGHLTPAKAVEMIRRIRKEDEEAEKLEAI